MKNGIILVEGGGLSCSKNVFTVQKKICNIEVGAKPRNLCMCLFKRLQILLHPRKYIFSLINFNVYKQKKKFKQNQLHTVVIQRISTIFMD
jgi:hypothetical protein